MTCILPEIRFQHNPLYFINCGCPVQTMLTRERDFERIFLVSGTVRMAWMVLCLLCTEVSEMSGHHIKHSRSVGSIRADEERERREASQRRSGFNRSTGEWDCPCGVSKKTAAAFQKHQRNCKKVGKTADQRG